MSKVIYCRTAPSIGELEGTPEQVWGTPHYTHDFDSKCVFFGIYGLADFYALWRHRGKKWILWAGSDIRHFANGYWLDDKGEMRIDPMQLAPWIDKNCENWAENQVEADALAQFGIQTTICPSFMGNISDFKDCYEWRETPRLYTSVSGDDFKLYGWDKIDVLAEKNPGIQFHLYGNTKPWKSEYRNVVVHGRVPKEQMNEEIKTMQGALRLTTFDGFSEILAKSIFLGQWPVSLIEYPHMLKLEDIAQLSHKKEPNWDGIKYYKSVINKFPWVCK